MNLATLVKSGKPQAEGRYVAFVRCQAVQARDWVEPIIMTWANDRWHSTFIGDRRILGWLGPLPVLKADDISGTEEVPMPEVYDL